MLSVAWVFVAGGRVCTKPLKGTRANIRKIKPWSFSYARETLKETVNETIQDIFCLFVCLCPSRCSVGLSTEFRQNIAKNTPPPTKKNLPEAHRCSHLFAQKGFVHFVCTCLRLFSIELGSVFQNIHKLIIQTTMTQTTTKQLLRTNE